MECIKTFKSVMQRCGVLKRSGGLCSVMECIKTFRSVMQRYGVC